MFLCPCRHIFRYRFPYEIVIIYILIFRFDIAKLSLIIPSSLSTLYSFLVVLLVVTPYSTVVLMDKNVDFWTDLCIDRFILCNPVHSPCYTRTHLSALLCFNHYCRPMLWHTPAPMRTLTHTLI